MPLFPQEKKKEKKKEILLKLYLLGVPEFGFIVLEDAILLNYLWKSYFFWSWLLYLLLPLLAYLFVFFSQFCSIIDGKLWILIFLVLG